MGGYVWYQLMVWMTHLLAQLSISDFIESCKVKKIKDFFLLRPCDSLMKMQSLFFSGVEIHMSGY